MSLFFFGVLLGIVSGTGTYMVTSDTSLSVAVAVVAFLVWCRRPITAFLADLIESIFDN